MLWTFMCLPLLCDWFIFFLHRFSHAARFGCCLYTRVNFHLFSRCAHLSLTPNGAVVVAVFILFISTFFSSARFCVPPAPLPPFPSVFGSKVQHICVMLVYSLFTCMIWVAFQVLWLSRMLCAAYMYIQITWFHQTSPIPLFNLLRSFHFGHCCCVFFVCFCLCCCCCCCCLNHHYFSF